MGWDLVRIGDICKTGAGGTPLKSRKEYYDGGMIPWLLSGEVAQGEIHKSEKFITQAGLDNSSAKIFQANTVLVAMYGATAGQVGILRCEAATNQAVCGIFPNDYFVPEFMFYAMLSKQAELISTATGNAQPNISQIKVKSTEIPLPPLPEQKRIVAVLDEAFAGIDAAVANTEKNLANGRELFESYLNGVFTRKGEGWVETTIGEQITLQRGFDITKKQQRPGTVPVVSSGGIKSYHDTSMATGPGVVMGRKGTIGKVHFVEEDYWPHDTTLWVKNFNGNHPKLAYYLFKSLDFTHLDTGTANPALNRNIVHPIKVSWPKAEMQTEIIDQLDSVQVETQHLESIYQQKLIALAELKQSILQKAFAGELTTLPEKTLEEAVA